jgi:hypothetical protein
MTCHSTTQCSWGFSTVFFYPLPYVVFGRTSQVQPKRSGEYLHQLFEILLHGRLVSNSAFTYSIIYLYQYGLRLYFGLYPILPALLCYSNHSSFGHWGLFFSWLLSPFDISPAFSSPHPPTRVLNSGRGTC